MRTNISQDANKDLFCVVNSEALVIRLKKVNVKLTMAISKAAGVIITLNLSSTKTGVFQHLLK